VRKARYTASTLLVFSIGTVDIGTEAKKFALINHHSQNLKIIRNQQKEKTRARLLIKEHRPHALPILREATKYFRQKCHFHLKVKIRKANDSINHSEN
jgi:Cft2 family RNA processing exonuclease